MPTALNKKRAEQSALHKIQTVTVTVTIEASEINMQRLAALMLLQDPNKPLPEIEDLGPLPWEPQVPEPTPALQIAYNAIYNDIMKYVAEFDERFGREKLIELLQSFGGKRVSEVPKDRWLDLLAALLAAVESAVE